MYQINRIILLVLEANIRQGEGTFTYENGYVQSGTWENDNFIE